MNRRADALSLQKLSLRDNLLRLPLYMLRFGGNLVQPFSRLLPRHSKLWAFGAPAGRFEGNSKYLYLWLSSNAPDVRCVWITKNRDLAAELRKRGYKAATGNSPKGAYWASRAGVYFVNDGPSDIHFPLSGGAKIFNLWHGVGLKNVQLGASVGYGAKLKARRRNPFMFIRAMRRFQRPSLILSTSKITAQHFFARCFGVPVERAPVLGYPRMDPMVDPSLKALALTFENYQTFDNLKKRFSKLFLYTPTLRVTDNDLLVEAIPSVERLSKALRSQDAVLALKLHPKTSMQEGWTNALPDNIVVLDPDWDLYPILDQIDCLITDYSSIFFDYIFFKSNGVVMYPFDFDRYIKRDRDLAWDYGSSIVGQRADTFDQLCALIETGKATQPLDPERLRHLREKFWDGEPGSTTSSERIYDFCMSTPGFGAKAREARQDAHSATPTPA